MNKTICFICGKEIQLISLKRHLTINHPHINHQEYFDKYILSKDFNIKCPYCGENKKFIKVQDGYAKTCKNKICINKINADILKNKKIKLDYVNIDRNKLKELIDFKLNTIKLQGITKHFKTKYFEEYCQIIQCTKYLGISEDINFTERLFHITHNLIQRPTCMKLTESCIVRVSFQNYSKGYNKYCGNCYKKSIEFSEKMSHINQIRSPEEEKKRTEKRNNTCMLRYGVSTPLLLKETQQKSLETRKINKIKHDEYKKKNIFELLKKYKDIDVAQSNERKDQDTWDF